MDNYIGFDIDSKKTVIYVVEKSQRDGSTAFKTDYWTNERLLLKYFRQIQ